MVMYDLQLVGGQYDAQKGLQWRDDGVHPVPEVILVGICPGDGMCFADERECMAKAGGAQHPAYWLPDEEWMPELTTRYEKERDHVYRDVHGAYAGVATFVIRGLMLPEAMTQSTTAPVYA